MSERFDAIIIGTGQAGPPLAGRMDKAGMKVAVIERDRDRRELCQPRLHPDQGAGGERARRPRGAARGRLRSPASTGPVRVDMARVNASA